MPIRFREGKVIHEDVGTQVIGSLNIMNDAVGSQHLANNAVSYATQIKDGIIGYAELTTGLQGSLGGVPGPDSIGTTQLKEPSVGSSQLYDYSVGSQKIRFDNIGTISNRLGSFYSPTGDPIMGLAYAPDTKHLWFGDNIVNYLYEIGTTTGNIIGSIPGPQVPFCDITAITLSPDKNRIWLPEDVSMYIFEIGTTTGNVIGSFRSPDDSPLGVAFADDTNHLWHSDTTYGYIYELGTTTGNVIGSFIKPFSSPIRDLAFDSNHNLWVAGATGGCIYKVGTTTGDLLGSITAELPDALEYVPEHHRLWYASAKLSPIRRHIIETGTVSRYSHLKNRCVDGPSIQRRSIGSEHILTNAVGSQQIKNNTIGFSELTAGLQGSIDCAHGTIHIAGTVHTHVTSGSIRAIEVGTYIVRRSGSFWPATQPVSGSVGLKGGVVRVTSGSVGILGGIIRITSGSLDARIKSGTVAVKEVGTFIISGNLAHDAVDSGNPVKIGGKATDYKPDTVGEQGVASVAAADRVNAAFNLRGELIEGVKSEYDALTNIGTRYDSSITTKTSGTLECWQYRKGRISVYLNVSGVPTDLVIEAFQSADGSHFTKIMDGPLMDWRFDDTCVGDGLFESMPVNIDAQKIKVKVTAGGTTGTNIFRLSNPFIYMRN
jgi:hypothetical protein